MRHQLAALTNTWTSLNTSSVASLFHLAATLSSRDQLLCPGMEIRLEVALSKTRGFLGKVEWSVFEGRSGGGESGLDWQTTAVVMD